MSKLIKFQFMRAFESKRLILSIGLLLLTAITGFVLCEVFYSPLEDSRLGILSLFNSFTQFFYLIFAYILVSLFADDIQSGSIILFRYMGFGTSSVVLSKIIYCLVLFIPIVDLAVVIGAFIYQCNNFEFLIKVLLVLDLSIIQVLLLACFLSQLIKKTNIATIVMYGCFLCFNIVNIFAYGLTNQADSNSLTTYFVASLSDSLRNQPKWESVVDLTNDQLFFYSVLVNIFWILLLGIIVVLTTCKGGKKHAL